MSYIKYDVFFDLTLDEVMKIQKTKINELQHAYNCIYSFIEETHKQVIEVEHEGVKRDVRVTFYSMILFYSDIPLKKEHLVNALSKLPQVD